MTSGQGRPPGQLDETGGGSIDSVSVKGIADRQRANVQDKS